MSCPKCHENICCCPEDDEYVLKKLRVSTPNTGCKPSEKDDCELQEKTYDKITSQFAIPKVGNTLEAKVCDASLYNVGQWVQFEDGNIFQIVDREDKKLVLRNSCIDGESAIETNGEPGDKISTGTSFWVTSEPDCPDIDALVEKVLLALREIEEICFPNIVDINNTEKVHLFGGTITDICVDENGELVDKKLSCSRKLPNIQATNLTICLPEIPDSATDLSDYSFAVLNDEGCLERLSVSGCGTIKVKDGKINVDDKAKSFYIVDPTPAILSDHSQAGPFPIGSAGDIPLTLPTPPSYAVCGDVICVKLKVMVVPTSLLSNQFFVGVLKVNGRIAGTYSANEQFEGTGVYFKGPNTDSVDVCYNTSEGLTLRWETIDSNVTTNNSALSNLKLCVWVEGFYA